MTTLCVESLELKETFERERLWDSDVMVILQHQSLNDMVSEICNIPTRSLLTFPFNGVPFGEHILSRATKALVEVTTIDEPFKLIIKTALIFFLRRLSVNKHLRLVRLLLLALSQNVFSIPSLSKLWSNQYSTAPQMGAGWIGWHLLLLRWFRNALQYIVLAWLVPHGGSGLV